MIVKECYVENFGSLHEQKFCFTKGLNMIKEDNGWGKSTLAAFIKNMLYGMEYRTARKELYDRTRFMPWNGGNFGGYIVFTVNDREYRAVRSFGKKNTDDLYELFDNVTNLKSAELPSDIGTAVFGIDADSFERSVFISLDGKAPEMQDNINAKLNNLIDATDDVNNYENAVNMLDMLAVRIRAKRGNGGEIGNNESRQEELKYEMQRCANASAEAENLAGLILECRTLAEKAEMETGRLKEIKNRNELENMKLCPSETETAEYAELKKKFGHMAPDERAVSSCMSDYNESLKLKSRLETEESRLDMIETLRPADKTHKKKNIFIPIALIMVTALFAILITVLLIKGNMAVLLSVIEAAAAIIVSVIYQKKIRVAEQREEEEQNAAAEDAERKISIQKDRIYEIKKELSEKQKNCTDFIMRYEPFADMENIPGILSGIRSGISRFSELKEKTESYGSKSRSDNADIDAALSEAEMEGRKQRKLLADYELKYERAGLTAEKTDELDAEKENLAERHRELEDRYSILTETVKMLGEAKENMSGRYMDSVRGAFNRYLRFLGGDSREIRLDTGLSTMVEKNGRLWKSDYYSKGFGDLINICMRFALIDAMFGADRPPVILDDPYVNLDDDKMKKALELTEQMGTGYQIFYFTCSSAREI